MSGQPQTRIATVTEKYSPEILTQLRRNGYGFPPLKNTRLGKKWGIIEIEQDSRTEVRHSKSFTVFDTVFYGG